MSNLGRARRRCPAVGHRFGMQDQPPEMGVVSEQLASRRDWFDCVYAPIMDFPRVWRRAVPENSSPGRAVCNDCQNFSTCATSCSNASPTLSSTTSARALLRPGAVCAASRACHCSSLHPRCRARAARMPESASTKMMMSQNDVPAGLVQDGGVQHDYASFTLLGKCTQLVGHTSGDPRMRPLLEKCQLARPVRRWGKDLLRHHAAADLAGRVQNPSAPPRTNAARTYGSRKTAWPIWSASNTAAPSRPNSWATSDLPLATPPVTPITTMVLAIAQRTTREAHTPPNSRRLSHPP